MLQKFRFIIVINDPSNKIYCQTKISAHAILKVEKKVQYELLQFVKWN